MELTIEISTEKEIREGKGPIIVVPDRDLQYVSFQYYSANMNRVQRCNFAFNEALTQFRIQTGSYIYIASTTETDLSELFNDFKEFFRSEY